MTHTYFIIRGFGKTREDFALWEKNFSTLSAACRRHNVPYTVIYSTPDRNPLIGSVHEPLSVIHVDETEEKFLWSPGLNVPLEHLLSAADPAERPSTAVIPLTFEVAADDENAQRIAQALSRGERFLAWRETPPWLDKDNPYSKNFPAKLLGFWNDVQRKDLGDILADEKYLQTMSLFGRNTLAHYFLSDFAAHGLFNAAADAWGGMEDWDFLLRFRPEFQVAVSYVDTRLRKNEPDTAVRKKREEKLAREIEALKKIVALRAHSSAHKIFSGGEGGI